MANDSKPHVLLLINAFRGLLLADQHDVHTHAGMKSAIGQYYVLTGLLSPEDSKLFSQMETMRERADYVMRNNLKTQRKSQFFIDFR